MRHFLLLLVLITCMSCVETYKRPKIVTEVVIEPILEDSLLSVRAIDFNDAYIFYGSADHIGKIGLNPEYKIDLHDVAFKKNKHHYKHILTYNDQPLNFRAIKQVDGVFFAISIENPARLYKVPRKSIEPQLVYEEKNEKVFYDAMNFWNPKEGIAIGDPTDRCMSIIITRDGGDTWTKLPCEVLPEAQEGEAAFAASNTNIAIVGNQTWVATGGKASRILYSPDKGKTWSVFETPIIQGENTTGIYSLDFYNETNGFAIGGDYTKPADAFANKIKTSDGGKTWQITAQGETPGYRSSVQYIPNRNGDELLAVGFKGIDYSADGGVSWNHLSDEGFFTMTFVNDSIAYAGGQGRISKLILK